MKSKLILIIILFLTILQGCDKIGVNSDYAQIYTISSSRENVISAIQKFKSQNTSLCIPDSDSAKFIDGYDKDVNGNDITLKYYVDFYFPDKGYFISTYIRSEGANTSNIGLISTWKILGGKTNNIQFVNHDLTGAANDSVKNEFVSRILNPIKKILTIQ